ncbi:hypothetical protein [Lysobacter sp. Root690]|uniref:hypothetical protein n=1 Tax=Lysobacter sp. Root690 TaxID=1736588 RepID=UPI0006F20CBE|nr:hypothetical protein [Lysobacter sp. Root690]KRB06963.1 hypothetical protein ASD86_13315 [Lysobacter sp. Root690]
MKTRNRSNRLALIALAAFGFAASLSAVASDDAACRQCRIEYENCLMFSEIPGGGNCDARYAQCVRTLDCPYEEI